MKNPPMKHPTKGEKMAQDARTHVLANEKSSNETPNERERKWHKMQGLMS
jgi:hypothetical protein